MFWLEYTSLMIWQSCSTCTSISKIWSPLDVVKKKCSRTTIQYSVHHFRNPMPTVRLWNYQSQSQHLCTLQVPISMKFILFRCLPPQGGMYQSSLESSSLSADIVKNVSYESIASIFRQCDNCETSTRPGGQYLAANQIRVGWGRPQPNANHLLRNEISSPIVVSFGSSFMRRMLRIPRGHLNLVQYVMTVQKRKTHHLHRHQTVTASQPGLSRRKVMIRRPSQNKSSDSWPHFLPTLTGRNHLSPTSKMFVLS